MSQLLDSLRKAHRARPDRVPLAARPRTSVVLSTLGLAPRRTRKIRSAGLVLAALVTTGSVAAGALVWRPAPGKANEAPPQGDFAQALAFEEAGDVARAIELYNGLLARDELPAQAHNNLGLIHQQRGQLDDAVREFENSLAHDPRYVAAAVNLGLAHKAAGRLDKARDSLLAALAISPGYAPAHYNLAVLYDRSGDRARAAGHYRAFLEHRGGDHASLTTDVTARLAALDAAR